MAWINITAFKPTIPINMSITNSFATHWVVRVALFAALLVIIISATRADKSIQPEVQVWTKNKLVSGDFNYKPQQLEDYQNSEVKKSQHLSSMINDRRRSDSDDNNLYQSSQTRVSSINQQPPRRLNQDHHHHDHHHHDHHHHDHHHHVHHHQDHHKSSDNYTLPSRSLKPGAEAVVDSKAEALTSSATTTTPPEVLEEPEVEFTNSSCLNQDKDDEDRNLMCRIEANMYLKFDIYKRFTCSRCYELMSRVHSVSKFQQYGEYLIDLDTFEKHSPCEPKDMGLFKRTFKSNNAFDLWRLCCDEALLCCKRHAHLVEHSTVRRNMTQLEDLPAPRANCPATWDGFSCWDESPADSVSAQTCPKHVYFFEFRPVCPGISQKLCFPNGSWLVRDEHEWTDYRKCSPVPIYTTRFAIDTVWHLASCVIIFPSLLILGKMPSRNGTKRIRILNSLLRCLLLNALFYSIRCLGFLSGPFRDAQLLALQDSGRAYAHNRWTGAWQANKMSESANDGEIIATTPTATTTTGRPLEGARYLRTLSSIDNLEHYVSTLLPTPSFPMPSYSLQPLIPIKFQNNDPTWVKKPPRPSLNIKQYTKETAFGLILVCWILSNLVIMTRLLYYGWMFTGAVYLCSILHYAPAEPPANLVKGLLISTNVLPVIIWFTYLICRSLYDRSPLNIIKWPYYYYVIEDFAQADALWITESECWHIQSDVANIEDILDVPNLMLMFLNFVLFMVTLGIMCRISGPGSTRPEYSVSHYFKAAGTLVVLFGAHNGLMSNLPKAQSPENCIKSQVLHYLLNFLDGLQGILVSFVFCYRTPEAKRVIRKWLSSLENHSPSCCLFLLGSSKCRATRRAMDSNSHYNQSFRSNVSGGNGLEISLVDRQSQF